jgi:hypothetical protein
MADCAVAPLKSCRYRTDARRNLQGRDTRQINHRPSLTNALSGSQLSAQTQNVDSSAGARKAAGWGCRNLDISGRAGRCRSDECVPAHLYWPARSPLGRQSILPWDDTSGEKPLGGARRPNFQNAYCNRVVALEEQVYSDLSATYRKLPSRHQVCFGLCRGSRAVLKQVALA